MISKSKYHLSNETIRSLFQSAGIAGASNVRPLGAGEFNSVYAVDAGGVRYALKVAPNDTNSTLTYEKDMLRQEIYYYGEMEKAGIRVPKIYFSDLSRARIPVDYFIMERLDGAQLDEAGLTDGEKEVAFEKLIQMVALLHKVKGEAYGYRQNGLHPTWYLAIRSAVQNLIDDAKARGKRSRRGQKLLVYIDKNKSELEKAECSLINYDIWNPNIFCNKADGKIELAWIDPERCFWGDRIADFICLESMQISMDKKQKSLALYNRFTDKPVTVTDNIRIRFAVMAGYLALIQEVEKYARYSPTMFGWWRNVFSSKVFYRACFQTLKKLTK